MIKGLLRFVIAVIFILSGFVKAVDLVGFSFKMEEYFSPAVFNMPFFEKFALLFSIIVVVLELLLGFMLLLKLKLKFTLSTLIALCVFFGFLTFYSAYFNVVTDCGCFGDAIKFTPWESFIKDIVLLVGLIILFILYRKEFKKKDDHSSTTGDSSSKFKYILLGIFSLIMIFIMSQGIMHEPMIDFRDYKIGTDLKAEKEKINKNPSEYKTFYSLKNQKTGEVLKVNQDDYIKETKYWEEGSPWKIEEGKNESVLIKEGYKSEIVKFKIEDPTGMEATDEVINAPKAILVFSYHPKDISPELLKQVEAKVKSQGANVVYGVSTDPNTFKTVKNMMMDGTAIKTIARSNPFVLVLQNGKIVDKQPAKDYVK
ncbi:MULTISPECIES: BT_3928 family protein [Chryseobacterium]|uniref:Membrane protein YphA (DoxX/SURF4 family) n=1 Tax=Chryseobacterium geocarposphaerae TaxID=1416776 RepID=A0ABU1LA20_9FLAO|nr:MULTISPECIES: BT_3928 family protein [Chryseobacterium]MDR6403562.1 putative membrane protein YphA (DoxX/SURF4 family) [Chryseobacterium geocarposphaerae]MDR6697116.1 putative membrane protein YphA (DoxX/SURF4 family) [Chryseobacterium ginsenosidimutans]